MKYLYIVLMSFYIASCGEVGPKGEDGHSGTDGMNGQNGYNSLIDATRFKRDRLLCSSGSGIYIKVGLDFNRDGLLSKDEVTNFTVICDED